MPDYEPNPLSGLVKLFDPTAEPASPPEAAKAAEDALFSYGDAAPQDSEASDMAKVPTPESALKVHPPKVHEDGSLELGYVYDGTLYRGILRKKATGYEIHLYKWGGGKWTQSHSRLRTGLLGAFIMYGTMAQLTGTHSLPLPTPESAGKQKVVGSMPKTEDDDEGSS